MTYQELKEKHAKEIHEFPIGWAFGMDQFVEMKKELPLDEGDKYYSIGAGGFVRGKDLPALKAMFARHNQEMQELRKNEKELENAFVREMSNHEYCITGDDEEIFRAVGIDFEKASKDEIRIFNRAAKKYAKAC